MSAARRAFASRANGRLSRGPRTAAGQAQCADAVRRDGLSLRVTLDEALAPEIEKLARELVASLVGPGRAQQICQSRVDPGLGAGGQIRTQAATIVDATCHALACRLAEAMIDLNRVRLAKQPLAAALEADPANLATLQALTRLERYEARAVSRRRFAMRLFAGAIAGADPAQPLRMRRFRLRPPVSTFGERS